MTVRKFSKGIIFGASLFAIAQFAAPANATLIGVAGPASSMGTGPAIIAAPSFVLDDVVTNTGMQGFDEAQGVVTSVAYTSDSGVIAAGTRVDSHMIFLNSEGTTALTHLGVVWTFDGIILGVMSDSTGSFEVGSTPELGAVGTTYPAAPFAARGLESNNGTGLGPGDGYQLLSANTLRVSMAVTEPGDWIRVVTATVPEPGALMLLGFGLAGLGLMRHRRKA